MFSSNIRHESPPLPNPGRLAFPAGSSLSPEEKLRTIAQLTRSVRMLELERERSKEDEERHLAEKKWEEVEQAWQKRQALEEQRRIKFEERIRAEALLGEKHWVRQKGILRDANGRRDYKRTEEIRKLVEREDREQQIIERWQAYENAWANVFSSIDKPLTFNDMPWPLTSPPQSPDDLRDPTKVADFLFESLSLEQNRVSRKERLRTALLRWHPDKLGSVLARVPEDELGSVKDGIDAVVISLMKLQETEKAR